MLAVTLIVVGAAMIWSGYRCAGSLAGFASDHSGMVTTAFPHVPGTARNTTLWLVGAVLEAVGYVLVVFGVAATL